jgi:hypothetical protein
MGRGVAMERERENGTWGYQYLLPMTWEFGVVDYFPDLEFVLL